MSDEAEIPRQVREAILSRLAEHPFPLVVAGEMNLRPGELRGEINRDPDFAREVEEAVAVGRERLTSEAYKRAVEGSVEDTEDGAGNLIRRVRKPADNLLSTLMKSLDPNMRVEQTITHRIEISPDERQKRLAAMVMHIKSQAMLETDNPEPAIDAEFSDVADKGDAEADEYDPDDDLQGLA